MAQLPPSPFISNSTAIQPSVDAAAASLLPTAVARVEPEGATATVSVSPGVACCSLPSGESEPSVTLAFAPGENHPSMTMEVPSEAPAPRCTEQHNGAGALADKLDWQELWSATTDERIVLFDEVPLFIRAGDHLRRWEA